MKFVKLNNDKIPMEKLSDGGHDLIEIKDHDNIGALIPKPFVVLDFDDTEEANIMLKIVQTLKVKCKIMKTTRGYHFWFKSDEPWKNFVDTPLAIGLKADCRSWGKLSYTVVKKDGEWREWIGNVKSEEVEKIPKWLTPVGKCKDFKSMKEHDARNQALFTYIITLQRKGLTKEDVRTTLSIINDFVLAEKMTEEELEVIMRDEAFLDDETVQMAHCLDDKGNVIHNLFGDELIKHYNIVTVNGSIYIYRDGYYQKDNRLVEQAMINIFPSIKSHTRQEVLSYIAIKTHHNINEEDKDRYTVNILNGRLNVLNRTLTDHSSEFLDFERVPVIYDPSAYDEHVDKMLDKVFCNDQAVRKLFEEVIGYCLVKHTRFHKAFILYGGGSNGKSTILNMMKRFLGYNNITSIDLGSLSEKFTTAELENKLANIGDDIDETDLTKTGIIKKLTSGESVRVARKFEQGFDLYNYAKLIFSANKLPYSSDKSDGYYRRFEFIPFNAKFSATDSDYDPHIEDKISTPNAMSYLLNLALDGVDRLFDQGKFTQPKVVEDAKRAYKTINSSVLTWIEEEGIDEHYLLSKFIKEIYYDYTNYCKLAGVKYKSTRTSFTREINDTFGFESKNKYVDGVQGRAFNKI